MARILSITSPTAGTEALLQDLQGLEGLIDLQVYRGAAISPPGDVIKVTILNQCLNRAMRILDNYALGCEGGLSVSTSDVAGIIPTQSSLGIERDNNEAAWEEMELTISDDSNTSLNTLLIMFASGALTVIGLATNALHIVVGGMLLAPGFMPITRVALFFVAGGKSWRFGVTDFIRGYLALLTGAMVMTVLLKWFSFDPLPGSQSYYQTEQKLVYYWTTITFPALLSSLVAAFAGALLIASKKSIFTSGVMVGLALVPSSTLISMAVFEGHWELAQKALLRFGIDVALVFFASLVVLNTTRIWLHKRHMHL